MLTRFFYMTKPELSIKARSTPASLPFKDQVTEQPRSQGLFPGLVGHQADNCSVTNLFAYFVNIFYTAL